MTIEAPENLLPVPEPEPKRKPLWTPLLLIAAGMALLAVLYQYEKRLLERVPWSESMIVMGEKPPVKDADQEPVLVRRLPEENLPKGTVMDFLRGQPGAQESLAEIGLDKPKREPVIRMNLPDDAADWLLASGRMPEPGRPEVLAGDLVRFNRFTMDGTTFEVVGRIRREIPAFTFAYVLPGLNEEDGPKFGESFGERGWFFARGFEDKFGRMVKTEEETEPVRVLGGLSRVPARVTLGTILGLIAVNVGFMSFLMRLLQRPFVRGLWGFRSLTREIALRPRLAAGMHLLNYGAWFSFMALALASPRANYYLIQMVQVVFTSGDLEHVGRAYASGNIAWAALVTFYHNCVVATLGITMLPSLFFPFWGVLKNLMSFTTLGFAMSPIWAGKAGAYVYHSLTMAMELETYILASFCVCIWPIRLYEGFTGNRLASSAYQGLKAVLGGALLAIVMLLIAAFYEATTIILLRP